MNLSLDISALLPAFPLFRVAYLAMDLSVESGDPAALDLFVSDSEAAARARLADCEIADLPEMMAWRAAYRAFGSKKTSYRNACEALLRRLREPEARLPRVLPLVDFYNALSVRCLMPVGADDLVKVKAPSVFRYSSPSDSFLDLARDPPVDDPPFEGEVVYADQEKCLCRRWNWRQDARSRIQADTQKAVIVIQTLEEGPGQMEEALELFVEQAGICLGARSIGAIADRNQPQVVLDFS